MSLQVPDVLGVLGDSPVSREKAGFCDVDQGHISEAALITVQGGNIILSPYIVVEVGQIHIGISRATVIGDQRVDNIIEMHIREAGTEQIHHSLELRVIVDILQRIVASMPKFVDLGGTQAEEHDVLIAHLLANFGMERCRIFVISPQMVVLYPRMHPHPA